MATGVGYVVVTRNLTRCHMCCVNHCSRYADPYELVKNTIFKSSCFAILGPRLYTIVSENYFNNKSFYKLGLRDDHGYARAVDSRIIHVRENTRKIQKRAEMDGKKNICLPEYAEEYIQSRPEPET